MKIQINPAYKQFSSFVENAPEFFDKEGVTIYKSRNEIKVFEVNGIKLNVKQYKIPFFLNRIIYTFFRQSKARRAYDYAFRLLSLHFETPDPVAYIIIKKSGLIYRSYFISLQSSYSHTMYEFGEGPIVGREKIITDLARYTAKMHSAGIIHCDYSPGNILFEFAEDETKFSLVDINRMKFDQQISVKRGCKNFARLWGKEDFFNLIAEEYAKERNVDEGFCRHWVFHYRKKFWDLYAKRHEVPFDWK